MIKVTFQTSDEGLKILTDKYGSIKAHDIAEEVKAFIRGNFDKSRNIDGSAMKPLSAYTLKYHRKFGAGNKPLVFTGQLRQATTIIDLTKDSSLVILDDKARGKTTNSGILDYAKKYGRTPWGLGSAGESHIKKYTDKIVNGN